MAIQKISSTVIGSGAVTSEQIATGAITAADIPDGEITTAKLANDAVTSDKVAEDSITSSKLAPNLELSGNYVKIPFVTNNTNRDFISAQPGMLIYNAASGALQQYISENVWATIAPSAAITSVLLPNSQTAVYTGDTITINGVGFDNGAAVYYVDNLNNQTAAPTTTRISSIQLTATIPALSEGTYSVLVINGTGVSTTLANAIDVDGIAVFNSPSGSLASLIDKEDSANLNVGAIEDGVNLNVSITSGSLPTGLSMNSVGIITGTPNTGIPTTTYSFTVSATDAENQTTSRNFSITVIGNYIPAGSATFGGN